MSVKTTLDSIETKSNSVSSLYSKETIDLLNYRIIEEEKSARLYDSMAAWLLNNGYEGAAKLWDVYAKEEWNHANWAREYLMGLDIQPEFRTIPAIPCTYSSFPDIVKQSLTHEVEITNQCNELTKKAHAAGDFMLAELGMRYMKEQHEEVSKIQDWVDQLKAFGTDKVALRLLDTEMGKAAL